MDKCEEAIAQILGLTGTDREILFQLCRKEHSIRELSAILKRSPPRIQQRIAALFSRGLVKRRKEGLARGYKYLYSALPKKEIVSQAKKELERRTEQTIRMLTH